MANRTTYTQARANLASLCDQVAETREPYVIERRNGENVALVSEAELNSLLETAHLLRSPKNARRLAAALERALGGSPASETLDQLRQSLGLEEEAYDRNLAEDGRHGGNLGRAQEHVRSVTQAVGEIPCGRGHDRGPRGHAGLIPHA